MKFESAPGHGGAPSSPILDAVQPTIDLLHAMSWAIAAVAVLYIVIRLLRPRRKRP